MKIALHRNTMTIRYLPVIHVEDLPESAQTASGLARTTRGNILGALSDMSTANPGQDASG